MANFAATAAGRILSEEWAKAKVADHTWVVAYGGVMPLYALLTRESAIGIFNEQGHLLRTLPLSAPGKPTPATAFLDVGPRSFLRLF